MNYEAVLALLGDLYSQIATLQTENATLRQQVMSSNIQTEERKS